MSTREMRPEPVDGATWGFYDSFRAFPLSTTSRERGVVADILLGLDDDEGGTRGEWRVSWIRFDDRRDDASPHLEVFSDAWASLAQSHLIELLATLDDTKRSHLTPDEFMAELRALGWQDRTEKLTSGNVVCPTCYGHPWKGEIAVTNWRDRVEAAVLIPESPS